MKNAPAPKSLDALKREIAQLLASPDIQSGDRAAAERLMAACGLFEVTWSGVAPPKIETPVASDKADDLCRSPYFGLGIGEAAKECIRIKGREMFADEIWSELEKSGFRSSHEYPQHSVYDALRKRAKRRDRDVARLPGGGWGLCAWYTAEQLAGFESAFRSERTQEGMETARSNGAQLGAHKKFTEERVEEFERRYANGESVKAIADSFGIHSQTIRTHYRREDLKNLREQAKPSKPGQKQSSSTEGSKPNLRVV